MLMLRRNVLLWLAGVILLMLCLSLQAQPVADQSDTSNTLLTELQGQLDDLKQQVVRTAGDKQLESYSERSQQILARIDALQAALGQELLPVTTQLNILGPKPEAGAPPETPEVVARRQLLSQTKTGLESRLQQTALLQASAQQLAVQIASVRRNILARELSLNNGSILTPGFWAPLFSFSDYNRGRFLQFWYALQDGWQLAVSPARIPGTLFLLAIAVVLPLTRKRLELPITRFTVRCIPEGPFIRSFYAMALIAANTLLISLAAWAFAWIFLRLPLHSGVLGDFFSDWLNLCVLTGVMIGLGRALISKTQPSWRLARISDSVAAALNPFPRIIAGVLFLFGSVEIMNSAIGASVSTSVVASGMTSLLILVCVIVMIVRVNSAKNEEGDQDKRHQNTSVHGVVYLLSAVFALVELIALLTGYIGLARYLTYKMIWAFIVIAGAFFLTRVWDGLCDLLFSPDNRAGRFLVRFLKLREDPLSLLAIVFSAIGKVVILLMMVLALIYGTFGSSAAVELPGRIYALWSGNGIGQLNIVPAHVLSAILTCLISAWALHQIHRWLTETLLPVTRMSAGMQASIGALFTNLGYVVVIMMTLASLGVQWSKLAWIVSALSVGIGFGLQEIVKNFISGLILLTERPVRVGDLVSISGIEGDIKKISVRATEIQLGDRSTMIVPNSQFISQNVRNVTRGNTLGVVTIALTYPLDCDPVQIRTLLLDIFNAHEQICSSPEPAVSCTGLSAEGITISATGFVSSARQIFGTKSDLLFELLHQLREQGIRISVPQTIIMAREPDAQSAAPGNP
ncbi:DUF3772 domain-containing protein [Shimwellia blattae]|uniref:Putative mechanosensitive ion channel protein n=1 Tax=Shimwellia blattae (strain ATCC 29907 / DSM 4481 / JCM 1650 / NBRC 105725 / CDC 9005-74) TaxID=630626 RepID=I2B8U4_SHIBC|nr:DUF3772 domain-containing protein [Shimwellia blattae]AFJ46948.1 putative mechanosensitive ion channel protein [Shimwellia blattae DSM 4481 = NBRC 105725]GAB82391.1 mechanosensitive ion channel family protein [Shimwellia blattae DSM 4481 = NBRC 105725]VDY64442.1 Potassium efflux system KefA precursor [Shimwellia blattae]VEC22550.1 Potassium efflux system KefA precursor [Shimwellia blattae]